MLDEVTVISPHADDAVFSAWSRLADGHRVTIVTVCAGAPPHGSAPTSHDLLTGSHEPFKRMLERRAEDRAVATAHGWRAIELDFLDTPYRAGPHDVDTIADTLVEVLRDRRGDVYVPAGIGQHPDHLAVRDATLKALARLGRTRCWLFADLPYASKYGWPQWVLGTPRDPNLDIDAFYDRALAQVAGWDRAEPVVVRMGPECCVEKLAAMRRYVTQFPAIEAGPSRALSHPDRLPYEVFWPLRRCERPGDGQR